MSSQYVKKIITLLLSFIGIFFIFEILNFCVSMLFYAVARALSSSGIYIPLKQFVPFSPFSTVKPLLYNNILPLGFMTLIVMIVRRFKKDTLTFLAILPSLTLFLWVIFIINGWVFEVKNINKAGFQACAQIEDQVKKARNINDNPYSYAVTLDRVEGEEYGNIAEFIKLYGNPRDSYEYNGLTYVTFANSIQDLTSVFCQISVYNGRIVGAQSTFSIQ